MLSTHALTFRSLVEAVATLGTLGSLFFYFLSVIAAASFLRHRRKQLSQPSPAAQLPPVSILKPLKESIPISGRAFAAIAIRIIHSLN